MPNLYPFIFGQFIEFYFNRHWNNWIPWPTLDPDRGSIDFFFGKKNTWKPGEDDPMKDEYVAFKWVGSSTNQLLLDFGWL